MTRYAAYIRTSTTRQATGTQSQRGTILEWFADRDVADWNEYVDTAQSGADDSREALRELLEAVRNDATTMLSGLRSAGSPTGLRSPPTSLTSPLTPTLPSTSSTGDLADGEGDQ